MINIIIDDDNILFRSGMGYLLHEIFNSHNELDINISHEITNENVGFADIIIKKFRSGEIYLCQDILNGRNKDCVVMSVCDPCVPLTKAKPTLCLENSIFISRDITLVDFKIEINRRLKDISAKKTIRSYHDCNKCNVKTLKSSQLEIAGRLFRKEDTQQIARALGIDVKTVSGHKRKIMSKFNLRSNCELHAFLSHYNRKVGL